MSVVGMSSDMVLNKASTASLLIQQVRVRRPPALYLSHTCNDNSIAMGSAIIRGPTALD
jgi:hypothetical protein